MQSIELPLETVKPGVPLRIEDGAAGIVVIRGEDSISAFEDSCPHARWRLSDGELCAGILECPGHGWEFDLENGRCLNVPAYQLRRYDVVVEDGLVRIMSSNAPPKEVEPKSPAEDSSSVCAFDLPAVQV